MGDALAGAGAEALPGDAYVALEAPGVRCPDGSGCWAETTPAPPVESAASALALLAAGLLAA